MRYQSADVSHVPPPNPDNYWTFKVGTPRMLGIDLAFRIDALHADQHADGDGRALAGRARRTNEHCVTLVLRGIEKRAALIQVVAHPDIPRLSIH